MRTLVSYSDCPKNSQDDLKEALDRLTNNPSFQTLQASLGDENNMTPQQKSAFTTRPSSGT
jgi:hypothetical protein